MTKVKAKQKKSEAYEEVTGVKVSMMIVCYMRICGPLHIRKLSKLKIVSRGKKLKKKNSLVP